MHVLIPRFTGALEGQHNESRSKGGVVLSPRFAAAPLGHTENLHEQDGEEDEQDQPQSQETQNDRQARTRVLSAEGIFKMKQARTLQS